MFRALVTHEDWIVTTPDGQTASAGNRTTKNISGHFRDRVEAVRACEHDFEDLKTDLLERYHNPLIAGSMLIWHGDNALPSQNLGTRGWDDPPPLVHGVEYFVRSIAESQDTSQLN